jgi:hypothetical protein
MIPLVQNQIAPLGYTFRGEYDYVVKALNLDAASFIYSNYPCQLEKE